MNYSYSDFSGDRIRILENKSRQFIKHGTFINHATYDTNNLSYRSQHSMFSNNMLQDINVVQHYGFSSAPLAGAKSVVVSLGGSNTNNVVLGTHDTRYQPKNLQPGEVALYDYQGQSISLKQNQLINITGEKTIQINIGADIQMTITDGNLEITGDVTIDKDVTINGTLHVKGSITSDTDVKAGSISLSEHTHTVQSAPGTTSAPE